MPSYLSSDPAGVEIIRLRQRGLGEILDQAFRLYRGHFITLLSIMVVSFIPMQVLFLVVDASLLGEYGSLIIVFLQDFLTYFSLAALAVAVMGNFIGKPVGFSGTYRVVLKHMKPL